MCASAEDMATPAPARTVTLETTEDVFLGDRLVIAQPRHGYRAGIDAVLLAAAVCGRGNEPISLLDVGAGVGTVGLCAAARLPQLHAVLYEREPELVELAASNIARNGLEARVRTQHGDVAPAPAAFAATGLVPESFDVATANPPFHDTHAGTAAAHGLKAASHAMPAGSLEVWIRFMARMVRPGGEALLIHKAESLGDILAAFSKRFGGVRVLPVLPRAGADAIRVLVAGTKGSRAPLTLHAPFVLHTEGQAFTGTASAILRHSHALKV